MRKSRVTGYSKRRGGFLQARGNRPGTWKQPEKLAASLPSETAAQRTEHEERRAKDEPAQPQIRIQKLPGPTGHRQGRAGRLFNGRGILDLLRKPYDEQPDRTRYYAKKGRNGPATSRGARCCPAVPDSSFLCRDITKNFPRLTGLERGSVCCAPPPSSPHAFSCRIAER